MRILMINVVCGIRSTGRICTDLATALEEQGHEVKIAYGREEVPEQYQKYAVRIGTDFDVQLHALKARIFDSAGFESKRTTTAFLKWAEEFKPDTLWLHNIHGYYINVELLFQWIKTHPEMQVKWTLHDCWAFTGHCPHFSKIRCNKWKNKCYACPQKKRYPASIVFDNSAINFERKKEIFLGVSKMTIYTPSKWLANLVKQSILGVYKVEVLNNTIDSTVFIHDPGMIRKQLHLENKKIVLGVASSWDEYKGLYDFYKISSMLDQSFQVILVGLTKKQIKKLPNTIIGVERTNNVQMLVNYYSSADVYVNPSYEETFGLTTLEAKSCGTPCIVYKNTACEEIIGSDCAVENGNINKIVERIYSICG